MFILLHAPWLTFVLAFLAIYLPFGTLATRLFKHFKPRPQPQEDSPVEHRAKPEWLKRMENMLKEMKEYFMVEEEKKKDSTSSHRTAECSRMTSWFFAFCLATCASFFANNSGDCFPSPSTPHGQPCGLKIPETGSNATAQYYDTHQNIWIWVDLRGTNMSEIQAKHWEYEEACVNVFNYDIVTPAWAKECSSWCERHFGNFTWNEDCAFGFFERENKKPMNVLRACQKASFSEHFALSSDASKLLCILIAVLGCCSGIALHVFYPEQQDPKFETAEEEGKLKLAPLIAIPGVTRKTEILFDISKMAAEFMLDTFSDFSSALMYLSHGQIFFGFYMLLVLAINSQTDLIGTLAFRDLCWSLKHCTPHRDLIQRKASEVSEGFAGLICIALFFLRVPAHDQNGQPLLSAVDLAVYTVTLITSMTGIYSGAEASIQAHELNLHPEMELDMDRRYEKFKEKSVLMTVFALNVLVSRVSVALTIALLLAASSTPFAKAKTAVSHGSESAVLVAVGITIVVVVAFKWSNLRISWKNLVRILSSNAGFVGSAFASCYAGWYLQELRDQGDWDNLPWHDEWIHLSSFGVKLEGSEDGHHQRATVVQAKYLINWSLIWMAEVCSKAAPVAAIVQILILVKENALAVGEKQVPTDAPQSYLLVSKDEAP